MLYCAEVDFISYILESWDQMAQLLSLGLKPNTKINF